MTKFLEALGGKLAERWLTLLVLPSLPLTAAAAAGLVLGHRHWHDVGRLIDRLNHLASEPAFRTTSVLVLVLAGVLVASAGLGLAASALGVVVERLWLADRPRWSVRRRRRRWDAAEEKFTAALLAAARGGEGTARAQELNARRNRISVAPPTRAFWLGDRIAAVDARVWSIYRLDLGSAWPRLWLALPSDVRAEVTTARTALTAAFRLVAWAVGYLLVGVVWWPSAVVGLATAATAWYRARVAGEAFAELTESVVDLYGRQLAELLGVECEGPLTAEVGERITSALRKDS
ncbi:hypothetical protein [Cryptosporangium phraense]|uniref:Vegetative cell wall protein gp1 n=1 Tax=Cryptosporangium phraense TaxID=2593070 RepID=A0A545AZV0_9ACTN|nr:hypothetical protein [Cryptosporangium phraense]TQS46839.1 hypothetical protein FL583_00745 [Cryptosporangium phraense]